jgi:hypothetical protein
VTSALVGGEWSALRPGERAPQYPLDRRLGGAHENIQDNDSYLSISKDVKHKYAEGGTRLTIVWKENICISEG